MADVNAVETKSEKRLNDKRDDVTGLEKVLKLKRIRCERLRK